MQEVATGKAKLSNVTADITNSNLPADLKSLLISQAEASAPKGEQTTWWTKVKNFFVSKFKK